MSSKIKWQGGSLETEKVLDAVFPKKRMEWVASISSSMKTARNTLTTIKKTIEPYFEFLSQFLAADPVAILLKSFIITIKKVVRDILSIGASAIIIHPFNVPSPRYIDFGIGDGENLLPPFKMKALSPVEAFENLKNSFNNSRDTMRPQWASGVKTLGFGLLLTTTSPVSLALLMKAFHYVTGWKEFIGPAQQIAKALQDFEKDVSNNKMPVIDEDAAYRKQETQITGNSSRSFTLIKDIRTTKADISKLNPLDKDNPWKKALFPSFSPSQSSSDDLNTVLSGSLPQMHWVGLSIGDVVYIKQAATALITFLDSLQEMYGKVEEGSAGLLKALINKVEALFSLLEELSYALENLLVDLPTAGIYIFTIPITPSGEAGGVQYLIDSLKLDDPTAVAIGVDKTLENNFSALFFAAAGGVDAEYWQKLGEEIMEQLNQLKRTFPITKQSDSIQLIPPVFDVEENTDEVFPSGRLQFAVLSLQETRANGAQSSNPYYAYQLSIALTMTPLVEYSTTQDKKVGIDPITFEAQDKQEYVLRVSTYDKEGSTKINEEIKDFKIKIDNEKYSEERGRELISSNFQILGPLDGALIPFDHPEAYDAKGNLISDPLATSFISSLPSVSYEYSLTTKDQGDIIKGKADNHPGPTAWPLPNLYGAVLKKLPPNIKTVVLSLEATVTYFGFSKTETRVFTLTNAVSGTISSSPSIDPTSPSTLPVSPGFTGTGTLVDEGASVDGVYIGEGSPVSLGSGLGGVQGPYEIGLDGTIEGQPVSVKGKIFIDSLAGTLEITELTSFIYVPSYPYNIKLNIDGEALLLLFEGEWSLNPLPCTFCATQDTTIYSAVLAGGVVQSFIKTQILQRSSLGEGICT